MNIETTTSGNTATIKVDGKLTAQTSPDLDTAIENLPASVCNLDIDLSDVGYISSAGLRVLVSTDKLASKRGGQMRLLHPIDEVLEVLEMTGLSEVFAIER